MGVCKRANWLANLAINANSWPRQMRNGGRSVTQFTFVPEEITAARAPSGNDPPFVPIIRMSGSGFQAKFNWVLDLDVVQRLFSLADVT